MTGAPRSISAIGCIADGADSMYNAFMRRIVTFAAFLLIISVVPVCAQHGGYGGGGGSHGGFSGGGHGGFGGHGAMGGHSVGGSFSGSHAGFAGGGFGGGSHFGPGGHAGFGPRGFRGNRFGNGYRFRNRWGYGYPYYGYPYYGYYDPFLDSWWWDSGSSFDQDYAQQEQMAEQMNEENLEEQQMLNQQDQDAYARRAPRARDPQPSREETAKNDPATVLVFRNGQQREIQNYAIVDGMLWNFMATRTERIPLAVLDIPATVRANDERGVDFHLPGTGEGQ